MLKSIVAIFKRHGRSAVPTLSLLAVVACANAAQPAIENGVFWRDTSGKPIYSQGGGMLKVGDRYWWYGVKYHEAVSYAAAPTALAPQPRFSAVTAYSSTDLVNWRFEGDVLKAGAGGARFVPDGWLGRMGVVFNQATRKYVLITQFSSKATGGGVLFATSDQPAGPFVYDNLQARIDNVSTPSSGDQTVFNNMITRGCLLP
jgi:hypothetical protein